MPEDKIKELLNIASLKEQKALTKVLGEILDALKSVEMPQPTPIPDQMKVELKGAELVTIKGEKGDKGDKPTAEDLRPIITPLIPEPVKGEKGDKGNKGNNGDRGEDGHTPVKGIDYFDGKDGESIKGDPGKDGSPDTGEQIVGKINELPTEADFQIDAAHIKNLPKTVEKSIIAHSRNLDWFDETTLVVSNPTQIKFQGAGVQVTQESTTGALIVTVSGGAAGNESNGETLTNSGDDTNFTFAHTPLSGGVRNVWIAETGQLLTPTTDYTISTNTLTLTAARSGITLISNYTY